MSAADLAVKPGNPLGPSASGIERLAATVAVLGGLLALAAATVVTASVLMRWTFNAPIDGDFEYVKMATALAVFAYLPYTQVRRGNIMVDTFTSWLPAAARRFLDAFWDITYGGFMGYIGYCMTFGTLGMYHSGETTMQRQLLLWPSVAICAVLAFLVALTALLGAARLIKPGTSGSGSKGTP